MLCQKSCNECYRTTVLPHYKTFTANLGCDMVCDCGTLPEKIQIAVNHKCSLTVFQKFETFVFSKRQFCRTVATFCSGFTTGFKGFFYGSQPTNEICSPFIFLASSH